MPDRLAEAASLDSDFDGWHGYVGERGIESNVQERKLFVRRLETLRTAYFTVDFRNETPYSQFDLARVLCCAVFAALIVQGLARMSEARQSDSVTIFHCDFGDDWDVNYDGWPDRWDRKTGADYPHYVSATIHDNDEAAGKKCLRIDLDGAAASVSTPPIAVLSRFSYVFEAQLKNDGLKHSVVVLSLDFCDSTGHVLQTAKTEPIATTNGWRTVRIGPIEPRDRAVDHAVVNLTVVRGQQGRPARARFGGGCMARAAAAD